MSTEFIPPIAAIQLPAFPAMPVDGAAAPTSMSFGSLVADGLRQVSANLQAGEVDLQRMATGDVENLHQVMIKLEESRLSFQLMLQVRNRLLESYQEVMRMQV